MPTLRRWGAFRTYESRMERLYGREVAEQILRSSYGLKAATPIAGFPAYTLDGCIVPRVSGGAGFSGYVDLRAQMDGNSQFFRVDKAGKAASVGGTRQLWSVVGEPVAGDNRAGSGAGSLRQRTQVGSLQQNNAPTGDTLHFVAAKAMHSTGAAVVMFDYLWAGGRDLSVTGAGTVSTLAPSRYQGAAAVGSWLGTRVTTGTGATPVSIDFTYENEAGATQTAPTSTSGASLAVHAPMLPSGVLDWFLPLLNGDRGIARMLTHTLTTASTGQFDFMLGHNIVCIPALHTGLFTAIDGYSNVFNFCKIEDEAALAFMEFSKVAVGAGNVNVEDLMLVAG